MAIRPPGRPGGELRPRAQLESLLSEARANIAETRDPEYPRGIAAALTWVLGRTITTPVTQRDVPQPTVDDLFREEEVAAGMLYGEFGRIERFTSGYVVGVEHTLMWCRGKTTDPPIDFEYPLAS